MPPAPNDLSYDPAEILPQEMVLEIAMSSSFGRLPIPSPHSMPGGAQIQSVAQ